MIAVDLYEGVFDAASELAKFNARASGAGAIASFTGVVRAGRADATTPVTDLILDHYPVVTLASMRAIADDSAARFGITHIRVVHRSGRMQPGEAIVFVAAAAAHRRAAFDATDYMMDRLKTEAVFWKREVSAEGSQWIEPRAADHTDRARWD